MKKLLIILLLMFSCSTAQHSSTTGCPYSQNDLCKSSIVKKMAKNEQCKSRFIFLEDEGVSIPVICFPASQVSDDSYKCVAGFKGSDICFKRP